MIVFKQFIDKTFIMKYILILVLATTSLVLSQDGKEPRFSIGLGVLAPSYSQKFDGNGRLDVDHNKNGFSYTLNNVGHPSSSSSSSYQSQSNAQQFQSAPGSDYSQSNGQFNIYQHRSIPKQSQSSQLYNSPSNTDDGQYHESHHNSGQSSGSPHRVSLEANVEHGQYESPASSGAQSYGAPQQYNSGSDYSSEGQNDPNSGPRFAPFSFEQAISHQFQAQDGFQNSPQYQSTGGQSYQSQPQQTQSYPQSYESQPSHQRVISLAKPIQSQTQLPYKTQKVYTFV